MATRSRCFLKLSNSNFVNDNPVGQIDNFEEHLLTITYIGHVFIADRSPVQFL
jgi:hypothetical protein